MFLEKDAEIFGRHMEYLPQFFQRKLFFIVCLRILCNFKKQTHLSGIFLLPVDYQIVLKQAGIET